MHQPLVTLFARHLLKHEVEPQAVRQPMLHLNRLRHGLELPEDSDLDLTAYGVERIRLRQARLRSAQAPVCDLWVSVPADRSTTCAFLAVNGRPRAMPRECFPVDLRCLACAVQ